MPISFDGTEGSFDACVSHFKNKKNNRTGKNFTSEESHKVCGALQHRQEKGKDYLFSENIEIKEQDEDYYIEGFISSSNPDLGDDIVTLEAMKQMVSQIEFGNIKLGYLHKELKSGEPDIIPIGRLIHAEIVDNKLFVRGILNKASAFFKEVLESIKGKFLDSFSIEFRPVETFRQEVKGIILRFIKSLQLVGVALTGRPMNQDALITDFYAKDLDFETILINKEELPNANNNIKEIILEDKMSEQILKEEPVDVKEKHEKKKEEEPKLDQEYVEFLRWKDERVKEEKYSEIKTYFKKFMDENKPILNKETHLEDKEVVDMEIKEITEYKQALATDDRQLQYKVAANLLNKFPAIFDRTYSHLTNKKEWYIDYKNNTIQYKNKTGMPDNTNVGMKGFNMKDLTTTANAESTYTQAAAEIGDVYDPLILSHLNERNITHNLLPKEDWSNRAKLQWRVKTARLSVAAGGPVGGYTEGTGTWTSGNVTRIKLEQDFSQWRSIVEVTGTMIHEAGAAGGVGDVVSVEMNDAMLDMLHDINSKILTGAAGTQNGSTRDVLIGFQNLCTATGNIYGKSRGTYTTLQGNNTAAGSAEISFATIRTMIRTVIVNGANRNQLVIITPNLQSDKLKALAQSQQRIMPPSRRVGFEDTVEFDGVPIFEDGKADTDDFFLIDFETTKLAIFQPPTVFEFGVDRDSRKWSIKYYFQVYSKQPNRNYWYSGLSTT